MKIKLGSRFIGEGEKTFIIAEAGSNHNRNWDRALALIDAAAASGADAVKFQLYKASDLYPKESPVYKPVEETELPEEWLPKLSDYCHEKNIIFLTTPFSIRAVDLLEKVGIQAYKIASSETINLPLLKHIASKKKLILLSTGMCGLTDVAEAVETIQSEKNFDIVLLQCSAIYPAEPKHLHLKVMSTFQSAFNLPVGFSDHSIDPFMPSVAVALGACVIEKHFTLDRKLKGPDHSYALEPGELTQMVEHIRNTEMALGSSIKRALSEEMEYARRETLHASQMIQAGSTIARENTIVQRPGKGIRPRFITAVLGKKAARTIQKGEAITWEMLQ